MLPKHDERSPLARSRIGALGRPMSDIPPPGARVSPSTARNREPILQVLRPRLPANGLVLEIAAGAGEHAVHNAAALPGLQWQPTDPDPEALTSIAAWRDHA